MDIRLRTGEILTEYEFRQRYSNTSFPNMITSDILNDFEADVIFEGAQPTGEFWQYAVRDGVEQIGDNWHWKYILGPTGTQGEIDAIKSEALTKLKRLQDDMVNDERARRILVGKDFNGIYLKGDQVNRDNLDSLAFGASLRIGLGDTQTLTKFRDSLNVDHELNPLQIVSLWQGATSYVSSLYQKSWEIKALEEFPQNYTDDSYWS